MLPTVWSNHLMDDLFDRTFGMMPWPDERELYGKNARNIMKTEKWNRCIIPKFDDSA